MKYFLQNFVVFSYSKHIRCDSFSNSNKFETINKFKLKKKMF